jgi:transposase-like protein
MEELSAVAQIRLSAIEFYYQIKDVSVVCKSFNLSRKSFYKWKARYEISGRKLSSLENLSRSPKTKRQSCLDFKTELDIKHIRKKYIR